MWEVQVAAGRALAVLSALAIAVVVLVALALGAAAVALYGSDTDERPASGSVLVAGRW